MNIIKNNNSTTTKLLIHLFSKPTFITEIKHIVIMHMEEFELMEPIHKTYSKDKTNH